MKKSHVGVFLVAFTVLLLQLVLIRVLDVIWHSNMGYLVITLALFSFGVSGVYYTLYPLRDLGKEDSVLSRLSLLYGTSVALIFVSFNFLPFRVGYFNESLILGISSFLVFFLSIATPFFLAGLIMAIIFSCGAAGIRKIYFYDLLGAGLGTIAIIPLIRPIGAGGTAVVIIGVALITAGVYAVRHFNRLGLLGFGLLVMLLPFLKNDYIELGQHVVPKRAIVDAMHANIIEHEVWDPISKIDVADLGNKKHIYFDGGSQSSFIYPFDGNFEALRALMPAYGHVHFWERHVILSHYLKRDSDQEVLVIGSAGGQEIKGALMYGAAHVDAVELVGAVVELMAEKYADYSGRITIHENVNNVKGEGRSFLQHSSNAYDIIQIFSNHTSSSIASGNGALSTNYLQTVEAYQSYFEHLKSDGILHINHHVYQRMITTAARAWKEMGRTDFLKHVVVWEAPGVYDPLPTLLIKMSPWTQEELDAQAAFFGGTRTLRIHPLDPQNNYLPEVFFSGHLPREIESKIPFRVDAVYDNDPYFNFLRKSQDFLEVDHATYTNETIVELMNSQQGAFVSNDVIHMVVTCIASVVFGTGFVLVPLLRSKVGREKWKNKSTVLVYFSCLGAGFIIFELLLIQKFLLFIGYPIYTYGLVLFSILVSAACGSFLSEQIGITPKTRWYVPFLGVLTFAVLFLLFGDLLLNSINLSSLFARLVIAFLMIIPLGLFLGMPFPLGVVYLANKPTGGIGWAWAMNGLFTVLGGVLVVILSIYWGFNATFTVAGLFYVVAFLCFRRLHLEQVKGQ